MQAALARRGLHGSERKMLHSARRKFLALALSLLAAASVLAAPASAATRLVKNTATVSYGASGIGLVNSNEVTLEVGSATIGGVRGGGAATLTLYGDQGTTRPIQYLLLGTTGYLKLDARACKNDPASLQTRIATLTTSDGDSEQVLATETAPDSHIFLLAPVPTRRGPAQGGSGQIETPKGATVTVAIQGCDTPVTVDFGLVDPVGIVFDSVTGSPVNGLDVSLFKASGAACTQQLATVLAPDELDALVPSPNPYRSHDGGRYQFPIVPAGSYCLQVASTATYTFPSARPLASQAPGRVSSAGSLGLPFPVGPEPLFVAIDLPVDPMATKLALFVNKKASRDTVLAGEQLQFTVLVKNVSATQVSHLTLRDAMSTGLSYLGASLRINDAAAADPKTAAGSLSIALPDLAPGKSHTISYRTALSPSAPSSVHNAASATAAEGISNTATVKVEVRRGFETDAKGVLTGTVYLACQAKDPSANPGVPGVRLLLEDGTGAVTDRLGRYSRYGLRSGTHVLKIDPTSLPEYARLVAPDGAGLGFIDLKDGELFKRNFALECTDEAQEQVKARATAPVTDEVFSALSRTFSAAVFMPGIGGASSLSSTGTGSARDLPAPGVRDAFGTAREFSAAGNERSLNPAAEAARAARSIVPAADQATALETALLAIETNEAAFLNLLDDQVLAVSTVSVQVKAPMESKLTVALDGVVLDESRIGQRSLYRDKAVMGIEYVGVK
ncbi:MAG: DUF11 domain-containing protein, partial [Ramlibacter sp.]|nr:DUF11 domain-containing protein [Ramlibacter sp.]